MRRAVLLVEGQGDVMFFEALFRQLDVRVNVTPPKNYGKDNTVSHFPTLIEMLFADLEQDRLDYLGIVADADYVSGGGFKSRWKTLTEKLGDLKYRIPKTPPKLPYTGSIFNHDDGLPPIGLYLMPSHQENGMLEDLLWQSLLKDPEKLQDHAENVVRGLPQKRFSDFHETKSMLYTWLAWQKRPGQTMDVTVHGKLLDYNHKGLSGFLAWLQGVFPFIDKETLR